MAKRKPADIKSDAPRPVELVIAALIFGGLVAAAFGWI